MEQALAYLNQDEKDVLSTIEKVIIWGYPLHSHTQSYVHYCWHKVFEALGKKTYWFEDDQFDTSLEYSNCLFIAEGYKDKNIPLHASNLYFINFCIEPQKYLRCGARLFEIRFRVNKFIDINNYWDLNDGSHILENLSDETLYESLTTNVGVSNDFTGPTKTPMNYEAVYMYWGTDLLPWEIDLNDSEFVPENEIHFVGTFYEKGIWAEFHRLTNTMGIQWIHHDPWSKPISFEANRDLIKRSIVAPDFRPESHLTSGYIPCRLFKNISYGRLPSTNSPAAAALLGDAVIYHTDMNEMIRCSIDANKDVERKRRAMKMVADHHTYLHRARDMLRAILKPRPVSVSPDLLTNWNQVTIVTALIHIGREGVDGRTMEDYIQWFAETLKIPAPMVVYVEPGLVDMVKQLRGPLPTKIVAQTLGTSPFGWSFPKVRDILESSGWKQTMKNPGDLTNKLPGYSIITNNKFAWLWNAMEENQFDTDMFFWIDGGLSRFFKNYDILQRQPHVRLIRDIRKSRKIFTVIGGGKEQYIHNALQGTKLPIEEVIGANMGVVMTGFFGGHISTMKHVSEYAMRTYLVEMIQKNRIDHDQSSIFLHFQDNPDKYLLIPAHPQLDCFNFFLFASGQHVPIGV